MPLSLPSCLPAPSLAASLWCAAFCVERVMGGQSLSDDILKQTPADARPATQDIVYGALRRYGKADALLAFLLRKKPPPIVHALLLCAIYRLETWEDSDHVVVHQSVKAAGQVARGHYKNLVNGVLRNYLRQKESLLSRMRDAPQYEADCLFHPSWWLEKLKADYPENWQGIVNVNNSQPPMALRVNRRRCQPDDYLRRLEAEGLSGKILGGFGILLDKPVQVSQLPGFFEGDVSVQDFGAQRAAELLNAPDESRVLDACAAPGGKTAHLLERNDINLTALDIHPSRCALIEENLSRLKFLHESGRRGFVEVRSGDASQPQTWGGQSMMFDAILADVPCSASGVVRRHPDIKWLRRPEDISSFVKAQKQILKSLWQILHPDGKLLYATCSIFPEENGKQVRDFLREVQNAVLEQEEQWLPENEHDGFYYALLRKR